MQPADKLPGRCRHSRPWLAKLKPMDGYATPAKITGPKQCCFTPLGGHWGLGLGVPANRHHGRQRGSKYDHNGSAIKNTLELIMGYVVMCPELTCQTKRQRVGRDTCAQRCITRSFSINDGHRITSSTRWAKTIGGQHSCLKLSA